MSYETELLAHIGTATDAWDIRAVDRRCYFFDFAGYPIRLWDGQGAMTDSGGNEWLGTIDASGVQQLRAPAVRDSRDGASPRYTFTLPFIDSDTFDALKSDRALAEGRELTCYRALFGAGEGLRPSLPLTFDYRLLMQGTQFAEGLGEDAGNIKKSYTATVLARSLEYGRSRAPYGTYTPTAQRERARLKGYSDDTFCDFVPGNALRTFVVGS